MLKSHMFFYGDVYENGICKSVDLGKKKNRRYLVVGGGVGVFEEPPWNGNSGEVGGGGSLKWKISCGEGINIF